MCFQVSLHGRAKRSLCRNVTQPGFSPSTAHRQRRIPDRRCVGTDDGNGFRRGIKLRRHFEKRFRNDFARLRPHRHNLEVSIVIELIVHADAEHAHHRKLLLHHNRRGRCNQVGAARRDDHIHFVDFDQLGLDAKDIGRVALVAVPNQLNLASQQTAFLVDTIGPFAHGDENRPAA